MFNTEIKLYLCIFYLYIESIQMYLFKQEADFFPVSQVNAAPLWWNEVSEIHRAELHRWYSKEWFALLSICN